MEREEDRWVTASHFPYHFFSLLTVLCTSAMTPTLHCITPVFWSIKMNRNMGFWQGVPKCFIWSWPFSGVASFMGGEVIFSGWTLLQASFHWPGYLSLSIDSNISPIIIIFACCTSRHIRLSHCLPNLPRHMSLPWPHSSSSTLPYLSLFRQSFSNWSLVSLLPLDLLVSNLML